MKKIAIFAPLLCVLILACSQRQIEFDAQKWRAGKQRYYTN